MSPVGTGHLALDWALSSSASGGGAPGVRGRPGRGTRKGDRVTENPHLRSHRRQHMPTAGREGGGPPRPPPSTPSPSPSGGRFGVPKPILQDFCNPQRREGPRVAPPAPGLARRARQPVLLNEGRRGARALARPCGQPQALAAHEAGWPSSPLGTGWPQSVLLWKLNAQPGSATPRPAQSSLVRSCHVAPPRTETQEVPTVGPGEWGQCGPAVMTPWGPAETSP